MLLHRPRLAACSDAVRGEDSARVTPTMDASDSSHSICVPTSRRRGFDNRECAGVDDAVQPKSGCFEKRSELVARSLAATRRNEHVQVGELPVATFVGWRDHALDEQYEPVGLH